jgi:chromosome segregation ATPase
MHIAQVDAQRNAQGRDEARNELRQCKQEIIELKAAICNKNETIAAQSRQYERLSLELGEVKTKNFANINRCASLQKQVGELEARLHGNIGNFEEYLKAENKKLQDKIEELWADNRQRAESYGELKRDYADIRSTNEAYIRENARLLAERDELKGRGRLAVADAEISGEVKPLNEGMKAAKPLCPSCHFLENCPTRPKEGDVATCKDYQNHDSV